MNSGKLSHAIAGWFVTVTLGCWAWAASHASLIVGVIVGLFSIRASLWTAKAAKSTIDKTRE